MLVKITNLDKQAKSKKGSLCTKIEYKNLDKGTDGFRMMANSFLDKNREMREAVEGLEIGSEYLFKLEKDGDFWNLVSIKPAGDSGGNSGYNKKGNSANSGGNNLGMRVGNVMNNATLLLVNKAAKTLEEAIDKVIAAQAMIEAKILGEGKKEKVKEKEQEGSLEEVDDDVDFDLD